MAPHPECECGILNAGSWRRNTDGRITLVQSIARQGTTEKRAALRVFNIGKSSVGWRPVLESAWSRSCARLPRQ